MGLYEEFINFEAVVNIKNAKEYIDFQERCKKLGLNEISIFNKLTFMDIHMSAGILKIPFGQCCIEYQQYDGFTIGSKESYEKYGLKIISTEDFLKETDKFSCWQNIKTMLLLFHKQSYQGA